MSDPQPSAAGDADEALPILDGRAFKSDSVARLAAMRKDGPVHRVRVGRSSEAWVVVGHEAARTALNHPRLLKNRDWSGLRPSPHVGGEFVGSMLTTDPPDHTRLRKLVSGAFTPRSAVRLRPRIREIADRLLDRITPLGEADLVESYTGPLPMTVISELLGVPEQRRAEFRDYSNQAMGTAPGKNTREGAALLYRYLGELLEEKRRRPDEALFSALARMRDEDDSRLSDGELLGTAFLLVLAGHETTVNLLGNALDALLRHPEQAALLRSRPDLLPGAVEEFLRIEAPVEFTPARFAAEDVEIEGVAIGKGDAVFIALGSANMGADDRDGAGVLDVTRKNARHLSFGYGIHHCLGAPLARAEGEIALAAALERLPDMRLTDPDEATPMLPQGIMRGPLSLPVVFAPQPS